MKGESLGSRRRADRLSTAESDTIAVQVFSCLVGDPERLGRFLAITGLAPDSIREASRSPGFLPSVLSYVASDEDLLVEIAREIDVAPEIVARADQILSPEATPDP